MILALRRIVGDRVLLGAALGIFANGVSFAAVMPYQSIVGVTRLGLAPAIYGGVTFVASLIAVLMSLAFGVATDRGRSRSVIMSVALVVGVVGNGLVALAPGRQIFVLAHLLMIPVSVGIYGQFFAVVRIRTAQDPGPLAAAVSSIVRTMFLLAWMLAPLLSSELVRQGYAMVDVYLVAAVGCAVALVSVHLVRAVGAGPPGSVPAGTPRGDVARLASPDVLLPLLLVGLVVGATRLATILLGLIVVQRGIAGSSDVGVFSGVLAGLEIPSMLLAGRAARSLPVQQIIWCGAVAFSIYLVGLAVAPTVVWLYVLTVPGAVGSAVIGGMTIGFLQDLLPHHPGAGSSLISVSSFVGSLAAAAIFGLGAGALGYSGVALVGAVLGAGAATLLLVHGRGVGSVRRRPRDRASTA